MSSSTMTSCPRTPSQKTKSPENFHSSTNSSTSLQTMERQIMERVSRMTLAPSTTTASQGCLSPSPLSVHNKRQIVWGDFPRTPQASNCTKGRKRRVTKRSLPSPGRVYRDRLVRLVRRSCSRTSHDSCRGAAFITPRHPTLSPAVTLQKKTTGLRMRTSSRIAELPPMPFFPLVLDEDEQKQWNQDCMAATGLQRFGQKLELQDRSRPVMPVL